MADSLPNPALSPFDWRWKPFDALTQQELYDALGARSAVFIIEQNCLYDDIDGLDVGAWHLLAYGSVDGNAALAGYLRVLLPRHQEGEPDDDDEQARDIRIGRVLTTAAFRGLGLGKAMLERVLAHIEAQWPGVALRLHAQAHLQAFYGAFGFVPISDIHEEDGIAHVWMRRR